MSIPDRELVAHLLGVTEPGDAAWLDARSGLDERLRAAGLAACMDLPFATPLPPLRGLAGPAHTLEAAAGFRAGDRLVVPLAWEGALDRARCVVYRRAQERWTRLFPRGPAWVPLARFPRRDGDPVADIVLEGPPGAQRFDLVLVHEALAEHAWDDDDPRWGRLHGAYLGGRLAGCTVEVEVRV